MDEDSSLSSEPGGEAESSLESKAGESSGNDGSSESAGAGQGDGSSPVSSDGGSDRGLASAHLRRDQSTLLEVEEGDANEHPSLPSFVSPVISANEWGDMDEKFLLQNNRLPEVDSQVAYALLDEYKDQLEVLGKVIPAPYIKDYIDETETLRERFQREEDEPIRIKGTKGDNVVPANPSLVKIQQDRAYLSKAITCVMKELRREDSYKPLVETVEAEAERRREFDIIEEEAIANSQLVTERQREIRELKASMGREMEDRDERILELRDELQEVLARTGMEVRYTKNATLARLVTNEGQTGERRRAKRQQAEDARLDCDFETRVNAEIESYLRDALDELTDILDARLTKFDVDTDTKERELSNLKYQKQQNFQALCEAREKHALYTRVIAEDDEELRLEEERIKELERQECAAIVIQSYWKGYKERKRMKKKLKKMKKEAKKAAKGGGKKPDAKGKKKK